MKLGVMKLQIFKWLSSIALILFVGACATTSSEESWGDDKTEAYISKFMSDYFPARAYTTAELTPESCIIRVKNGPSVTFTPSGQWTSVVGYGATLPQIFLFDQLPPDLYEYIQGLEAVDKVYSVVVDNGQYSVIMLDTSVVYDRATGTITQPSNFVKALARTLK